MPDDREQPPSPVVVEHERKPVLYLPNGTVLIRVPGFIPPAPRVETK